MTTQEVIFHIRLGTQVIIRGRVHWTEMNLGMRHSFFYHETSFVFITSRSGTTLTTYTVNNPKKQFL